MQEGAVNGYDGYMHTEMKKALGDEYDYVNYTGVAKGVYWTPIMYRSTIWQIEDRGYWKQDDMHRCHWALFSKIDNPDEQYIIINVHLDGRRDMALKVNETYQTLLTQYPDAKIFMTGDMNTKPGNDAYLGLIYNSKLKGAETLTENVSADLGMQIDHVFVQSNLVTVDNYRVLNNTYLPISSDHLPVFADISLTPPEIPEWESGEGPGSSMDYDEGIDIE
jgi:endonuclease/exonuclease/phosphatase family metal-dependent hydrolase